MWLEHFWEAHSLQVMLFLSSHFWFYFDTSSCFASVALLESLEVLENKVGSFYPWNHTERWISQPIFAGPQSPLDDFQTTFWDLCKTFHVWLQQSNMRIDLGAKSTFGPVWARKCPKTLNFFHMNPFHDRIESIKSAGKRSWRVTLETCPGVLLDKFISRRISGF